MPAPMRLVGASVCVVTGLELERIAANTVRPAADHAIAMVVVGTTGGRLANGSFSGVGGQTLWSPVWFDGIRKSQPIHLFESQHDARALADLLDPRRSTLGPAPRSVAGAAAPAGTAEGGAAPSAVAHDSRSGRRTAEPTLGGSAPAASTDTHSGPGSKPSGVPADQGADALAGSSSDGGSPETERAIAGSPASPGPRLCAACGRDLASLPPSPMAARRTTCSVACRQAKRRGHTAPVAGVVDEASVERLSRLGTRFLSGFGRGDPDPAPDPNQLAMPISDDRTPAPTRRGRPRPPTPAVAPAR